MAENNTKKTGRSYAGLSQQERKKMRYEQFMQAGLDVFGSSGYRQATVRGMCRQAQLTDRYFYESFGSLEKLLVAVYERCMTSLSNQILQVLMAEPAASIDERLEAGLQCFFTTLEDPRVARVIMLEVEGVSPEVSDITQGYMLNFARLMAELSLQLYPHWQLQQDEKEVIGIAVIGAMRQLATSWLLSEYDMPKSTLVKVSARIMKGAIQQIELDQQPA